LFSHWFPGDGCRRGNGDGRSLIIDGVEYREGWSGALWRNELFELLNLHNLYAKLGKDL